MLQLLLKKNEFSQIYILRRALKDQHIKKNSLITELNLNTVTFARYIRTINQELAIIFPDDLILIETVADNLTIHYPTSISSHQIIKTMILFYFKHSNTYHVLQFLLNDQQYPSMFFLDQINVSQSYFNKLVKQMNTFLEPSAVKIVQRNKKIYFDGPQTNIIYLEFLLRTFLDKFDSPMSLQGETGSQKLPSILNFSHDHDLSDLNHVQLRRLEIIYLIFNKYVDRLDDLVIPDQDVQSLLAKVNQEFKLLDDQLALNYFQSDTILLINLIIRNSSTQVDSQETRNQMGALFLSLDHPITNDTKALLTAINRTFAANGPLPITQSHEIAYIVTFAIMHLRLFESDFKKLFTFDIPTPEKLSSSEENIYQLITAFYENELNFKELSPKTQKAITENRTLFVNTSYTTVRSTLQTKLYISLDFLYQLNFELFLKQRLLKIFNADTLVFVENNEVPDLVISDYISDITEKTELFIFSNPNSIDELNELLAKLTKMVTKKLLDSFNSQLDL